MPGGWRTACSFLLLATNRASMSSGCTPNKRIQPDPVPRNLVHMRCQSCQKPVLGPDTRVFCATCTLAAWGTWSFGGRVGSHNHVMCQSHLDTNTHPPFSVMPMVAFQQTASVRSNLQVLFYPLRPVGPKPLHCKPFDLHQLRKQVHRPLRCATESDEGSCM